VHEYLYMENRFKMLTKINPEEAKRLFKAAQEDINLRWKFYESMAAPKKEAKA
jgi:pyruvate-ferredoxin/flavodoxin oxidoreductase